MAAAQVAAEAEQPVQLEPEHCARREGRTLPCCHPAVTAADLALVLLLPLVLLPAVHRQPIDSCLPRVSAQQHCLLLAVLHQSQLPLLHQSQLPLLQLPLLLLGCQQRHQSAVAVARLCNTQAEQPAAC